MKLRDKAPNTPGLCAVAARGGRVFDIRHDNGEMRGERLVCLPGLTDGPVVVVAVGFSWPRLARPEVDGWTDLLTGEAILASRYRSVGSVAYVLREPTVSHWPLPPGVELGPVAMHTGAADVGWDCHACRPESDPAWGAPVPGWGLDLTPDSGRWSGPAMPDCDGIAGVAVMLAKRLPVGCRLQITIMGTKGHDGATLVARATDTDAGHQAATWALGQYFRVGPVTSIGIAVMGAP